MIYLILIMIVVVIISIIVAIKTHNYLTEQRILAAEWEFGQVVTTKVVRSDRPVEKLEYRFKLIEEPNSVKIGNLTMDDKFKSCVRIGSLEIGKLLLEKNLLHINRWRSMNPHFPVNELHGTVSVYVLKKENM